MGLLMHNLHNTFLQVMKMIAKQYFCLLSAQLLIFTQFSLFTSVRTTVYTVCYQVLSWQGTFHQTNKHKQLFIKNEMLKQRSCATAIYQDVS